MAQWSLSVAVSDELERSVASWLMHHVKSKPFQLAATCRLSMHLFGRSNRMQWAIMINTDDG